MVYLCFCFLLFFICTKYRNNTGEKKVNVFFLFQHTYFAIYTNIEVKFVLAIYTKLLTNII